MKELITYFAIFAAMLLNFSSCGPRDPWHVPRYETWQNIESGEYITCASSENVSDHVVVLRDASPNQEPRFFDRSIVERVK